MCLILNQFCVRTRVCVCVWSQRSISYDWTGFLFALLEWNRRSATLTQNGCAIDRLCRPIQGNHLPSDPKWLCSLIQWHLLQANTGKPMISRLNQNGSLGFSPSDRFTGCTVHTVTVPTLPAHNVCEDINSWTFMDCFIDWALSYSSALC